MTIAEILDQAKTLSPQERKELAKRLIDTLETGEPTTLAKTGAEIVAMLENMNPIEFVDADIEDPVEWVKAQRGKRAIGMGDCLIAAVAYRLQMPLYTHNLKDMTPPPPDRKPRKQALCVTINRSVNETCCGHSKPTPPSPHRRVHPNRARCVRSASHPTAPPVHR